MAPATLVPSNLKAAAEVATDRLLSATDAASYLGVQEQTLAVWRSTGRYGLEFIKIGRLIKYRLSSLDEFLERNTATQTG